VNKAKIYVGNLPFNATSDELRDFFGACGNITDVRLIVDRETNRSKGFGFVTFESESSANSALDLNDTEMGGRRVKVSIAREPRRDDRRG
jgi:cold-inducible RNA-binding protein